MKRVLTSSSALFWGLQFAFLNPVLALLLVELYDATPGQVGGVLAVYNASGFVASLLVPAYADRRHDYLRPMLLCGALTFVLAGALWLTSSLPVALVALVVIGAPAGVGPALLFAHLKFSGAPMAEVIHTRAIVSFAWVAGPALATLVMGGLGNRSILPVLAVVAVFNMATTFAMMAQRRTNPVDHAAEAESAEEGRPVARAAVVAVVIAFIALQATNSAAVSIMSLFVTQRLDLALIWSGIALGASALLEIPALLVIGRLSRRVSSHVLVISGCVTGAGYYVAMAFVADPDHPGPAPGAQRMVLRHRRRRRPHHVPADDPASGPGLRAVHQHSPPRRHRLRTDHRVRLRHGRGLPGHLRGVRCADRRSHWSSSSWHAGSTAARTTSSRRRSARIGHLALDERVALLPPAEHRCGDDGSEQRGDPAHQEADRVGV